MSVRLSARNNSAPPGPIFMTHKVILKICPENSSLVHRTRITGALQWKPIYIFYHACLLTSRCRVLLEKLTGLQLVKKFPAFHGTRRFNTALTSFRQLSLSWASPIQFIYPHPTSWRSVLMLSTHVRLGLPSDLLPFGFPTKTLYTPLLTHTCQMSTPSQSSRFYYPHNIG